MFTSIYIYRVPPAQVDQFLAIQREAAEIYRRYGALDDETWEADNLDARYGCAAFPESFEVRENEVVFVSLSRFRDRAHHDEVMAQIDHDRRINDLYEAITSILDIGRIVRGEFTRVV